jgi:hypothetical protein
MARSSKAGDDHVADLVDRLLADTKRPVGEAVWREGNRDEMRIRWPLLVGSSVSEAALHLTAFPNSAEPRFSIGLVYRACVARLDFVPNHESHTNPLSQGALLDGTYRVRGPHYHAWADNRYLATAAALPRQLLCARELPPQIRKWDQAFRWFCDQVSVGLSGIAIPDLPPRSRLL